jgi:hypothetical protein
VVVRRDQVGRDDQDKVNASSDMAGYVYCIWTVLPLPLYYRSYVHDPTHPSRLPGFAQLSAQSLSLSCIDAVCLVVTLALLATFFHTRPPLKLPKAVSTI